MKAPFELKTEHEPKDRLAVDSQKNNASSDIYERLQYLGRGFVDVFH